MTYKIRHNGKQYEVGKIYCSSEGYIGTLDGMDGHRFIIGNGIDHRTCLAIKEIDKSNIGKITCAPIELEEGCWYMTHANLPMYWTGESWTSTGPGKVSRLLPKSDFAPLYKMERAK